MNGNEEDSDEDVDESVKRVNQMADEIDEYFEQKKEY